jgi:hypothetical protein
VNINAARFAIEEVERSDAQLENLAPVHVDEIEKQCRHLLCR